MNRYPRSLVVLLAFVLLACTQPAAAQDEAPPAADPAMEAMMASMAPGPEHATLASLAGTWDFTMKMWGDPSAPPETTTGTAERTMVFGGRVLEERVSAELMGMPFEGQAHTGYDNVTGEWWSTWMDNMGTGVMVMKGTVDEEDHTVTWEGEMSDPMAGGRRPMRIVTRHEGPDKEVSEFYWSPPAGGEMVRTMEIVYERR